MKMSRCFVVTALVTLAAILLPLSARAEEGGCGHYMPGAAASFIDALPGKPGLAVASFFTYYDASAGAARQLPFAGLATADIEATVYAETVVAIYETPLEILGGHYAACVAIPYVWMEVEGQASINIGPIAATRAVRDTTSNVADITLYPFMLGWKGLGGDLKYDLRLGVYAPTGDFKLGHLANPGKNYWTFEPGIMASWLSSKIGTEVSLYAAFDFSTKNDDTDYQSGDVFHVDATIAQHLPLLGGFIGVGATGFYYQQIGGDSGSGARFGGFEGRTVGVGPVASYAHKVFGKDLVGEVKWLPELDVEKRLEGDYVWFKLAMLF